MNTEPSSGRQLQTVRQLHVIPSHGLLHTPGLFNHVVSLFLGYLTKIGCPQVMALKIARTALKNLINYDLSI